MTEPTSASSSGRPDSSPDSGDGERDRSTTADSDTSSSVATRIVVSYPADLSAWGRFQVEKPSFRAYLRKTRDTAHPGDVWEEFVGVGCCGNTLDVPLRVESIDGGSMIDTTTDITYDVREACGIDGSWRVQSKGGPRRSADPTRSINRGDTGR